MVAAVAVADADQSAGAATLAAASSLLRLPAKGTSSSLPAYRITMRAGSRRFSDIGIVRPFHITLQAGE